MKKTKLIYWITTSLIALAMIAGGIMDIVQPDGFAEDVAILGYPLYFFTILGVFKIIGSIFLIVPSIPEKLKGLAYAGFLFDLVYAALSHGVVGEFAKIAPPVILLIILMISYQYKSKLIKK